MAAVKKEVRSVVTKYQADASGLNKSLRTIQTSSAKTAKEMQKVSKQINFFGNALKGFAAALSARELLSFAASSVTAADKINKAAQAIGVSTEELQRFRFAVGQLAGVSFQQADTALQRFSRRIGEAASGYGVLLKEVKRYGIELRDQRGNLRSNIELLKDFADVFKSIRDAQERTRLAQTLFDSEGVAILNAMVQGGRAFGDAMSEASIYSQETLDAASRLADEWGKLVNVLATPVSAALIDTLDLLSKNLAEVATGAVAVVIAYKQVRAGLSGLTSGAAAAAGAASGWNAATKGLLATAKAFAVAGFGAVTAYTAFKSLGDYLEEEGLNDEFEALGDSLKSLQEQSEDFQQLDLFTSEGAVAARRYQLQLIGMQEELAKLVAGYREAQGWWNDLFGGRAVEAGNLAQRMLEDVHEELGRVTQGMIDAGVATDATVEEFRAFNRVLMDIGIGAGEALARLETLRTKGPEAVASLDFELSWKEAVDELDESLQKSNMSLEERNQIIQEALGPMRQRLEAERDFKQAQEDSAKAASDRARKLQQLNSEIEALNRKFIEGNKALDELPKVFSTGSEIEAEAQKLFESLSNTQDRINKLTEERDKLAAQSKKPIVPKVDTSAIDEGIKRVRELSETLRALDQAIYQIEIQGETPAQRVERELREISNIENQAVFFGVEYDKEKFERAKNDIIDSIDEIKRAQEELAESMADAFSSAIEDIIVDFNSWRDVVEQLERDILRMITRILVTKPLQTFLESTLGGLAGSIVNAGAGRAFGGAVTAGQTYLVGERGPEVFQPAVNGRIIPNTNNTTINVNVSGGYGSDRRSANQIATAVGRQVNRAMSRYN